MKNVLMGIAVALFGMNMLQAQENRDVQQETTVKKVTQKGTEVKTKVIKKTNTDKEVLKVEGTDKQDQAAKVLKKKKMDTQVVADEVSVDVANQHRQLAIQQKHEAEMARKIAEQKAEAAAQAERERQAKIKQRQAEMEGRREALMKRPEGMARLKKDR